MKMKRFLCLTLLMTLVAVCLPAAAEEQMTMRAYCGICEQQTTFVFLKWGDYNNGHIAMMRCSNCKKRDAANWNTAGEHICSSSGKCSVCGDIYMKKDALHDMVSYAGKAATCTEAGWEEYETCTRCGWTTYKESPALNHDYQEKEIIKPTCEKDGYTLYACTLCGDSYTENPMKKLYHWYGEWTSDDNGVQSAVCRRDGCENIGKSECQMFDFLVDGEVLRFCPVCGAMENGERLELIENASAEAMTESLPMGEVVVRTNKTYLSLAFEYAGECTMPTGWCGSRYPLSYWKV